MKFHSMIKKGHLPTMIMMVLAMTILSSCELIDPSEVRNPQVTDESLIGQAGSLQAALQGVRNEFTNVTENIAYFTDVVSDNYDNVATFISPSADNPRAITYSDLTLPGVYTPPQNLRAYATFAIEKVAPGDPDQTGAAARIGELRFYRGMATLMLGENFAFAPLAEDASPSTSAEIIDAAIPDLSAALSSGPATIRTAAQFALARAYHARGNKAQAVSAATAALGLSATYVFSASFDAQTNTNSAWTFAVARALNDIQPLARLDYLDPKYTDATGISPIAVLKAEEMFLIQAEAAISDNNLAGARTQMKNAITLALSTTGGRTVVNFRDVDPRTNRARTDATLVKADADAPARAGLVRARGGATIPIKQISNTSISEADVDLLVTVAEHLSMLHLLRQEIFFLEGRRMSDLGIRLPVPTRELETNPTMSKTGPGSLVVVPAYIPNGSEMDNFTLAGTTATILHNMNKVLANNKVARFTIP
ncbi:MAG: hypothetical protein HYZ01_10985 [Ignavibacteriales bacterium]|nr:hypothetical protein [Ignavibacteriales bacterium]